MKDLEFDCWIVYVLMLKCLPESGIDHLLYFLFPNLFKTKGEFFTFISYKLYTSVIGLGSYDLIM